MDRYLNHLPIKAVNKIYFVVRAVENLTLPYALCTKYANSIVSYKGLSELRARISHRQERILYCQLIGNKYYLLWGFTKQKPQDIKKALKHAKKLRLELIRRYKNGTLF